MENKMTVGTPLSLILKFMLPILVGFLFQQLYNMVDTVIVGRFVGPDALAAVGSTGTIMFMILGVANGLTTGFTVLISQKFGRRHDGNPPVLRQQYDPRCHQHQCHHRDLPHRHAPLAASDEYAGQHLRRCLPLYRNDLCRQSISDLL